MQWLAFESGDDDVLILPNQRKGVEHKTLCSRLVQRSCQLPGEVGRPRSTLRAGEEDRHCHYQLFYQRV